MKIWLLDVYKKTEELIADQKIYSSSIIRHFDGYGFESIPLPHEFDLVLIDFMNAGNNQLTELLDHRRELELKGQPQRKSIGGINRDSSFEFSHAAEYLSQRTVEALEAGIPLVVIGGKFDKELNLGDEPLIHSYSWLLNTFPFLKVTDQSPAEGPASIDCVSLDRSVKELADQFEGDLTWEVAFDGKRDKPFKLLRKKSEQSPWSPLFENKKKQPVGFVLQAFNSELILLPNIRDCQTRSRYIAYILNEFLPHFRPGWYPDRWSGTYIPEVLKERSRAIEMEKKRILEDLDRKEARVQGQINTIKSFIDLVTQADHRLVTVVKRSFNEIFGAKVTDLDSNRDGKGKPRLFDLLASIEGRKIAIEIKGGKRSLSKDMLDKVQANVGTYLRETNDKLHGTVLVLNDQSAKAPGNRESFAPHMIQDAEQRKIAVLSTPVLMDLMAMRLTDELSNSDFLAIITKPGLVKLPKK
ncbi:hypothetical protein YDYSY3_18700 [Paenibacillus chitinolyticus]|uniref:hypothetical protein n=1 Tax=Paenibacillus chitinolyticus TaxID=79263 RepID=UPI0026E4D774|nr:hypothetical protein [Paenibacillus chitinolyticus]GKS10870.1 hypothetical protein YDYSY3_18700 [Paenibacillus chitinolyticus]